MKRRLISTLISLLISAALVSGWPDLHDFALYMVVFFNVLAWLGLLTGTVKGDVVHKTLERPWLSWTITAIHLAALIYSGHPLLAASVFICCALTFCVALNAKEKS